MAMGAATNAVNPEMICTTRNILNVFSIVFFRAKIIQQKSGREKMGCPIGKRDRLQGKG
jgi:hypothetical protein